jgi:hypothetical protein
MPNTEDSEKSTEDVEDAVIVDPEPETETVTETLEKDA